MPGSAVGLTTALVTSPNETTYGTPAVCDRGLEFDSESLERKNEIMPSQALRSGTVNLRRGSRRVVSARWGEGSITCEVVTNGMGRLFQNALGGTSTNAVIETGFNIQTHSLGSSLGKSLTIQKQLRDESNAIVSPFTFHGCKFPSVEFAIDKKGKLMMTVTVDAEDVDTTTAAASPVYTATRTYHYRQGTLKIDGAAFGLVQSASVKFDRKLDTDRFHLGNAGVKAEPLVNDFPDVTGTLSAEFASTALYAKFTEDTPAALILEFEGDTVGTITRETFRITVPEIRLTGETPKVGGPGLVVLNHPFEGQYNGVDPGMKVEYITTDATL
jgi:hypothetical protein